MTSQWEHLKPKTITHLFKLNEICCSVIRLFTFSEKKPFGVLYREFCDMVDALSRHLVEHHNSLLSTSLLHDAESHHWQDSKMFFEVKSQLYCRKTTTKSKQIDKFNIWNVISLLNCIDTIEYIVGDLWVYMYAFYLMEMAFSQSCALKTSCIYDINLFCVSYLTTLYVL